jgi:hypothetical protein
MAVISSQLFSSLLDAAPQIVKGGVKIDHWGGGKVDHFLG